MPLNTDVINSAVDKEYTKFSDSVKAVFADKLNNHPDIEVYKRDLDNIRQMKVTFADINGASED